MSKLFAFYFTCMLVLSACGTLPGNGTNTLILEDHALSEKVWDVKQGRFIDKTQLMEQVHQSEFILLGETHDNQLHHQYQSWVISQMGKSGFSAMVAFEMINNAQGEVIEDRQYTSSSALINDLNQVKTTWQYERLYRPVFDSTLQAGYPVFAANLDRATIMGIARKGEEQIPSPLKPYLEKNALTEQQKKSLREEIKMSHCGMDNPHMTEAMMLTQQVKDAAMANSLLRQIDVDKRLLVAGSGHVRKDRGVPMYLRGESEGRSITAIAWLEVVKEMTEVEQYSQRWGDQSIPFDYIWFTARVDRPDPCKSFREHMKKKKDNKIGE